MLLLLGDRIWRFLLAGVRKNGERGHVVEDVVAAVLRRHGIDDVDVVVDVMENLDDIRLVDYRDRDVLPLLSVAGRVLVTVSASPEMTMREMSLRLGVTESNVARAVGLLVKHGLVTRSRVGRRNRYSTDLGAVLGHPDVAKLLGVVGGLADAESTGNVVP